MPEYLEMYNRARKWMFYLLSIFVLGWGFTSYKTIFLGLILGTSFSIVNLIMLIKRMEKFGKQVDKGAKKVPSVGSLSRLAVASLTIVIALRWKHYFQIGSVVLGLMTNYIVIMIDYFFHSYYAHKTKKKVR